MSTKPLRLCEKRTDAESFRREINGPGSTLHAFVTLKFNKSAYPKHLLKSMTKTGCSKDNAPSSVALPNDPLSNLFFQLLKPSVSFLVNLVRILVESARLLPTRRMSFTLMPMRLILCWAIHLVVYVAWASSLRMNRLPRWMVLVIRVSSYWRLRP